MFVVHQSAAEALDKWLMSSEGAGYSLDQLMEVAGLTVAQCVADFVENSQLRRDCLILCGSGNNGGDGLVAARYLSLWGYKCRVYCPKTHLTKLTEILRQFDNVDLVEDTSKSLEECSFVLDAIFGFGYRGAEPREPWKSLLQTVAASKKPIISVDVPSGWKVDEGPVEEAEYTIYPACLVSLTLPKPCSTKCQGAHYLGGRFVPQSGFRKFELTAPSYPGSSLFVRLV